MRQMWMTVMLSAFVVGLAVQAEAGPGARARRGAVAREYRELRQDRREIRRDQRKLRRDRRRGASPGEIQSDRRELRRDHRELRQHRRDMRRLGPGPQRLR